MSKTFRDQRSRPKSGKSHTCKGCTYCYAGEYKRQYVRKLRRTKARHIRSSLDED